MLIEQLFFFSDGSLPNYYHANFISMVIHVHPTLPLSLHLLYLARSQITFDKINFNTTIKKLPPMQGVMVQKKMYK